MPSRPSARSITLSRAAGPALLACLLGLPASGVQPDFRVYDDQFNFTPLQRLTVGLRLDEAPLASLTTSGATNAATLESQTSWDFTPAAGLVIAGDTINQIVPATSAWTCYLPDTLDCGFGAPGAVLVASDGVVDGRPSRDVGAVSYDPATGILRGHATVQDEGTPSATLGEGEIRLCLGGSAGAPVMPVAVFPNVDGGRRFMRFGDPGWQTEVFACLPAATLNAPCGATTGGTRAGLTSTPGVTEGRIRNRFVRAGTLTLPTGHVVDSLLVERFTSYAAQSLTGQTCVLNLLTLRQWRLAWVVPHYGVLASLTSADDTPLLASFQTAKSAFLGHGLLPPVSIEVTATGTDSVAVAWDPGALGERFVDGYEVHWGPVSGRLQAPAFHSGPIPAGTTSYEITGLAPGQTIHVSVTSRKSYQDPVSGVTTAYESIKLPQVIGADIDGDGTLDTSYPPEVSATTLAAGGCVPGDIHPDGVGNGAVTLGDFALARRKVLGLVAVNDRDRSCGDVHPGEYACQPEGEAGRWCAAPNGLFQTGDAVVIRRRVAGTLLTTCGGCPQVARGGVDLRLPGDVAPRGAPNGILDVADVVMALRSTVGLETLSAEELLRADLAPADRSSGATEPVGNGLVDVADIVLMLRAAVGLETLRWPVRTITARMNEAQDFVAFRAEVSGWPPWAAPEPNVMSHVTNCDENSLSVLGDRWIALCVSDPVVHQGPTDLFSFQYRAPADVALGALAVAAGDAVTHVSHPGLATESRITLTLSTP